MRGDGRDRGRHAGGTDEPTDDDIFLDAVEVLVLNVLDRIGDDPQARFEFYRRLLAAAREVAEERGQ